MSFETSPNIVKPSTDIPANSQNGAPTAAAVASSIREAISKNNNKPSIEAGTFSVSAMEERRREQEEDKIIQGIIQEIENKINKVLASLTSSNNAKIKEIEQGLSVATKTKEINERVAILESLKSNIEMTTKEAMSPISERFIEEISSINGLASSPNLGTKELVTKFDELLIEKILETDTHYILELKELKSRVQEEINKSLPSTTGTKEEGAKTINTGNAMTDAILNSGLDVSSLPKAKAVNKIDDGSKKAKVGAEVSSVTGRVEDLDLRVSKIQEGINNLERKHAKHEEEAKKTSTTMEQLQKELAVVVGENSNLKGHMFSELRSIQGAIDSRTTNHEERIDSANSEAQNLKTKIDELSKKYNDLLGQLNSRINKIYDNRKRYDSDVEYEQVERETKARFLEIIDLYKEVKNNEERGDHKQEQLDELRSNFNDFTKMYAEREEVRAMFDNDKAINDSRLENNKTINDLRFKYVAEISKFLSTHKQQNDLGAGKLELSNTDAIIDPPKEGEYRMITEPQEPQSAVSIPAPAAAKNSLEAVLATEAKFDPIKDITNREVRLQSDAGIPIIYTLTGDVTYEGGQEMYKTYSGAILTREQVQSGLMSTDTTTTDDVESSIEQPSANQMPADTGTEDRNPFRYIPENVDADETGTVSPAIETSSTEAVSAGEVGPTTENEPEMGAAGAEQADSITGGAGVAAPDAKADEPAPKPTPILDPMPKFGSSSPAVKMTPAEIDSFKNEIDREIGRNWSDQSHSYKAIDGGLIDLLDKGALAVPDVVVARKWVEASIAKIEDLKAEGKMGPELNMHLSALNILKNKLEAIEYDTKTKEAEIATVEAEISSIKDSDNYLEALARSKKVEALTTLSKEDLHAKLAETNASLDNIKYFINSLNSVDRGTPFIRELNTIANNLDNKKNSLLDRLDNRYKAEIEREVETLISETTKVRNESSKIGAVTGAITRLMDTLTNLDALEGNLDGLYNAKAVLVDEYNKIELEIARIGTIKETIEKVTAAKASLESHKVRAGDEMRKRVEALTPADNIEAIRNNLTTLSNQLIINSDYIELDFINPNHPIINERNELRDRIEEYLTALGGRRRELEQQAAIERARVEIATIEAEMRDKYKQINEDMERLQSGTIARLTTIPEEDSDENPLSKDQKEELAQSWEEYRICRMDWKYAAIRLNNEYKGRLDALRNTIYTTRLPIEICRKFVEAELAANKEFKKCKDQEKQHNYTAIIRKAKEVMVKRDINFTRLQSFNQIKNGPVAKSWWQFWK